jgi:hypothetical protein
MATIDEAIDALLAQGVTGEQIIERARLKSGQATKDYFIDMLRTSPGPFCITFSVTDWPKLIAFFQHRAPDEFYPSKIYQELSAEIKDAVKARNANRLIFALLMAIKSQQP